MSRKVNYWFVCPFEGDLNNSWAQVVVFNIHQIYNDCFYYKSPHFIIKNITIPKRLPLSIQECVNELRGKTKNSIKSCFTIDGNLIEDKREISNGFNNFFSSIARNMNVKLHSSCMLHKSPKFTDYLDKRVCSSIFLYQCSRSEVCEIIKEFQSDMASDISVRVLKELQSM